MNPGIYAGIPNAEYHGGEGISNSGLSTIKKQSALHYLARKLAANDNESTPAQQLGTAFHALILEPKVFTQEYTLGLRQSDFPEAIDGADNLVALLEELNKGRLPKLPATGAKEELIDRIMQATEAPHEHRANFEVMKGAELKACIDELNKDRAGLLTVSGTIPVLAQRLRDAGMAITLWSEIKDEWMRNNGHRNILEPEQWDQLMNMRAAVLAHPAASVLLAKTGQAELSAYFIDAATGELCRFRPDFWCDDPIIVDLKSTMDASPEGFRKSIANYGYDMQCAFYKDGSAAVGRPAKAFVFIAVENTACVVEGQAKGVGVYVLDADSEALGRAKYREALTTYSRCRSTGVWPCYGDQVQTISLPTWNFSQNQHLVDSAA